MCIYISLCMCMYEYHEPPNPPEVSAWIYR